MIDIKKYEKISEESPNLWLLYCCGWISGFVVNGMISPREL